MADKNNSPIGIFDSGLGGLTVVKELMRQLPLEDIVYYGDTARVPYGTKSRESIIGFSLENTKILLKYKVKMVIVACNSSSSYALNILKNKFPVPIIGVIHAGAQKAAVITKNKRIGVIATSATIKSGEYVKAIRYYDRSIKVFTKATPLLVPLAEEGWLNKSIALKIAQEYLISLKKDQIDTLILGCTHYPLLRGVLQKAIGKNVILVDSAKEVAHKVKKVLSETNQKKVTKRKPHYKYLISDRPQHFRRIAKNFLGAELKHMIKV